MSQGQPIPAKTPEVRAEMNNLKNALSTTEQVVSDLWERFDCVLDKKAQLDKGKEEEPISGVPLAGEIADFRRRLTVVNRRLADLIACCEL